MTLGELAFGCYVYSRGYDEAYERFLAGTAPALDLNNEQHRMALLEWLRKWGCRQFKKDDDLEASGEIKSWHAKHGSFIPASETLLSLDNDRLDSVEAAYADLVNRTASYRRRGQKQIRVTIGPAGTAKILFAFRPNALMPWDDPIREKFGWDGSAGSYRKHLAMAKRQLLELEPTCTILGFGLSELPSRLCRPQSSLVKMIDEYLWVTVTNKCVAPDKSTIEHWIKWW